MELQNGNSETAQNKIQTDHDEDIETETWKQITKNSVKTHPKNTMQKKAQNEPKTAGREPDGRNGAKIRKRGLFHSPIFHITCIIRNLCNQKIRPSSLFPLLVLRSQRVWLINCCYRKYVPITLPAMVWFQSMRRSLHSMHEQSAYIRPYCRTGLHRYRWSQNTAPPARLDNLHLPES